MINKLREKILSHGSIIIMALGSLLLFVSNILLKKKLSPEEYGEYSLFITYLSLINSFGLLGCEQVFLRISKFLKNDFIETSKRLFLSIILIGLIFSFILSFILENYFLKNYFTLIYICTVSISLGMFQFNILRLNAEFLNAQILGNSWRIILGVLVFTLLINSFSIDFTVLIYVLTFVIFLSVLISGIYILKRIRFVFKIDHSSSTLLKYSFHFFIALSTLSLIGNIDKFYIEFEFGKKQLGDYFYLANLFIFPFSLLQSYVGFKELVHFKNNFNKEVLNKKIEKINVFGIALGFLLVFLNYILFRLNFLDVDLSSYWLLVFFFILTGVLKLNYAIQSSVFGAIGEISTIKLANFQSLILIFLLGLVFILVLPKKIEYVGLAVFFLWLSRVCIWKFNINKQLKKNEFEV
ncbi:hypothetical protein [Galbibacter pacificus]|uniref:Polysaccharide biosynthesis protein n=1 Tax=Galbibacter pacificus TaxID=2996052 RepID=A0ABT6FND2_9FLAO|nr:hypothetical protein [Galbibacter pacificus]MDG3581294.1 hypothetical protein [Galbibacter pacificus]MDG3584772.1 hypothetical protein [Galbibacter pacificus]